MTENRTEKVREICRFHVERGCRGTCPLAKACIMQRGDTKEIFDKRINLAAEALEC